MSELSGSAVPRRADRVVQAAVDGELVLMSPKDFAYFGTAGSGDPVWELIDGSRSVDQIVADLESRFAAEPGVIRTQTLAFLDALQAAGLVTVSAA